MSFLQISSLLLSWTLLFVWSVWTTSFEHPLFGVKLEVIVMASSITSVTPPSAALLNTAFSQAFILHDRDGL